MSNQTRPKLEQMVTPPGEAVWPKLSGEPDVTFSKDGHGHWKTGIRIDTNTPEGNEFVENLKQRHKAAQSDKELKKLYAEYVENCKKKRTKPDPFTAAPPPWKDEVDEAGKETGIVIVNFKMKASGQQEGKKPWKRSPTIVDSKGTPIRNVNIGSGSLIRVSFEVLPFWTSAVGAGLSLRMNGVKLLRLVEYGGRDAASLGLDQAEEGYVYDPGDAAADGDTAAPGTSGAAGADGW
jgi:hypothetical protein